MLQILFPSLDECKIVPGVATPRNPFLFEQIKLVHQCLALFRFSPLCSIFLIIDQWRFSFTPGICPDILMNVVEDCIIFLTGQLGLCLIFILSKNKGFPSGPLLKMYPSFPSMGDFGVDIQK